MGSINSIDIYAVHNSILEIIADAVVSCDNADGEMVSTSAAALRERGGGDIEEESTSAPRELGTAWLTSPGRLPVTHVLHVGVLQEDETTTAGITKHALADCVRVARKAGMKAIAMPPIGIGRGLTEDSSIMAMADGFRTAGDGTSLRLAIVVQGEQEFGSLREKLRRYLGSASLSE